LPSLHSFKACGTSEEVEKDSFSLIVGVMSKENMIDSRFGGTFLEKTMPRVSGRSFDREAFTFSQFSNIDSANPEICAQKFTKKSLIIVGLIIA
jgi:hypothetical protein